MIGHSIASIIQLVKSVKYIKLDGSYVFLLQWFRHIEYCMHRVNLLRHYGVKPILVFDGGYLPMKADQENKRARYYDCPVLVDWN